MKKGLLGAFFIGMLVLTLLLVNSAGYMRTGGEPISSVGTSNHSLSNEQILTETSDKNLDRDYYKEHTIRTTVQYSLFDRPTVQRDTLGTTIKASK